MLHEKKYFCIFNCMGLPLTTFAQNATIKIDVTRTIGEIDPKIYGVFMEPIHSMAENGLAGFRRLQHTLWKSI